MSDRPNGDPQPPPDLFDAPLIRYAGDAVLTLEDGRTVDLNTLAQPFTGEPPRPADQASRGDADDGQEAAARKRLGRLLRVLRENAGVSRAAAATQAGIPESRLAAIESGNAASLTWVSAVVAALHGRLGRLIDPDALERSTREFIKLAADAGAPREVLNRIAEQVSHDEVPAALARGFAWLTEDVVLGVPRPQPLGIRPVFKTHTEAPPDDSPVLALARKISELAAGTVTADVPAYRGIPAKPQAVRAEVLANAPDVTLQALLDWAWNTGVVVVPLSARRDFVAAVWFVDERPVIVLNDARKVAAYWVFDLAHELGHLALGHARENAIVEVGPPTVADLDDNQEEQANNWALALLLPDPDAMLADVRKRTAGNAPKNFKFAVRDVAAEAGMHAGPLGLIAARAMPDLPDDNSRWGSATNLAKDEDPDGRGRVREELLKHVDLTAADHLDLTVLRAGALA
ncbi:MAG: hypothetical protein QOJ29_1788 [Thermoleophilaceae bacterium]|jgi:transcriptional regulator with XRE-family HTH domain|nr:hypothetical protein [Thermoleophilaceae bacterium]